MARAWLIAIIVVIAMEFVVPAIIVIPLQRFGVSLAQMARGWGHVAFGLYSELSYGFAAALAWHAVRHRWWMGGRWRWNLFVKGVLGGVTVAIATSLAGAVILKIFRHPLPSDVKDLVGPVGPHPNALIALLVVLLFVAPVMEEWLFRGTLQTSLTRAVGTPLAVAIVALLFAGIHELDAAHPLRQPWIWTSILPLAIVLGIVRAKTRSMSGNIGIHWGFNAWGVFWILWPLWH